MAEGSAPATESVITDELRALIGKKSKPVTYEVDKSQIHLFAQAIGDANSLFHDPAAARQTRYGSMIAPPTFTCALLAEPVYAGAQFPYTRRLNGGEEWQYFEPIRPGDRITVVNEIADLYEKRGSMGNMLFLVTRRTFTNQFGKKVAIHKNTLITY